MVRGVRLLAAVGVLVALWSAVSAAPIEGKWKATVYDRDQAIDLALLEITGKDRPEIKLVSAGVPILKDGTIKNLQQKGKSIHFTLAGNRSFEAIINPTDDKDAKTIRGLLIIGESNVQPLVLERSDAKELDSKNFIHKAPGAAQLAAVTKAENLAEAQKALKTLEEKEPGSPLLVTGTLAVLRSALRSEESKVEDVQAALARAEKEANLYGARLASTIAMNTARELLRVKKHPALALDLAQQDLKTLTKDSTPEEALAATQLMVEALKANKKNDEAKKFEAQIAALETKLDEAFSKSNLSFEIKPFERKGKGTRTAVVELFTGAQCPPCVSADIAFDACNKAFKPGEAVFLQYHLHIPGPDALTNPASVARADYYGDAIGGTPTALLNGKETKPLGGYKQHGEDRYKALREAVGEAVEAEDAAKLTLDVQRAGDKITIEAKASDVAKPGEKVKLRLVLIEDVVKYVGRNGQRLHHHVVRDFPGGVEGLAVKDKSATQKVTVSVKELQEKLTKYLDEYTARGNKPFADEDKPLGLKHLKVVALLQNDETKEILQAVQANVPEAK